MAAAGKRNPACNHRRHACPHAFLGDRLYLARTRRRHELAGNATAGGPRRRVIIAPGDEGVATDGGLEIESEHVAILARHRGGFALWFPLGVERHQLDPARLDALGTKATADEHARVGPALDARTRHVGEPKAIVPGHDAGQLGIDTLAGDLEGLLATLERFNRHGGQHDDAAGRLIGYVIPCDDADLVREGHIKCEGLIPSLFDLRPPLELGPTHAHQAHGHAAGIGLQHGAHPTLPLRHDQRRIHIAARLGKIVQRHGLGLGVDHRHRSMRHTLDLMFHTHRKAVAQRSATSDFGGERNESFAVVTCFANADPQFGTVRNTSRRELSDATIGAVFDTHWRWNRAIGGSEEEKRHRAHDQQDSDDTRRARRPGTGIQDAARSYHVPNRLPSAGRRRNPTCGGCPDEARRIRMGTTLLTASFRRAAERWFRHIEIDDAWGQAVAEVTRRGPVVYVLRNVSILDYLALDFLTHKYDLPRIGFVNELPASIGPRPPRAATSPAAQLRAAIETNGAAALFVKRGPARADRRQTTRGRAKEGDTLLSSLLALQSERPEREIMMMPQTFVWTQRPERRGFSVVDTLFGPADFPGELRMAAQFLLNYKNCRLRAGEPISLRAFLRQQGEEEATEALVRRLTWALLRKVERERRVIVGPAQKPPDRIREDVLRSPKLQKVIGELAGPGREQRLLLTAKARGMLRELMTTPEPEALRSLAVMAETVLERVYSGIDIDRDGLERLRKLRTEGSVILLPSHKSHVDYIVLSYLLRKNGIQIPVIAAGDNLSFFPAGPILRRCGAFFIRRKFRGDRLYTAVVDAYMRRLLLDGWMIEFFLEGGRSRSGKLLAPMLGLLNMIVASALGGRPVFFVPIAIGYERLMEESTFARELSGEKKAPENASQLWRLGSVLTDRWGRVNVQFGETIALSDLVAELRIDEERITPARRRAIVKRLAHRAMREISRVTGVTPGSLVALVLLNHGRRGVAYRDLLAQCRRVTKMLLEMGARPAPSLVDAEGQLRERSVRDTLRLHVRSNNISQHVPGDTLTSQEHKRAALYAGTDMIFTVDPSKRLRLDFAKNNIIHWLVDRALVSLALLCEPPGTPSPSAATTGALRERVQSLSRLFKFEFMFRADAPFDAIYDDVLRAMSASGEVRTADDVVSIGPGHSGLDGREWLGFYANLVRNFIEGYVIAARSLGALVKGPVARTELVARALRSGRRMFLQGEIDLSESVSQPVVDNAFSAFIDQGYLLRDGKRLMLAESFQSAAAAAAIEARVAAFMQLTP